MTRPRAKATLPPVRTQRLTVNRQGRVVLPARMRNALGVGSGGDLVASLEGDQLVLRPVRNAEERLLRRWAAVSYSSKELIRERRREAKRDAKE